MSYRAIVSDDFKNGFRLLPRCVWNFSKQHIHRLTSDPVAMSRSAEHPWPRYCQMYQPDPVEIDGIRYRITILFRYKQDEAHIELLGIGHETEPVL
jgi:hypothetical protein